MLGHVWIYLRKSRALGDPDDPQLLEAHRSQLLRLAELDGHPPQAADIRREIGSAERLDDRPAFRQLLTEWDRLPPGAGGVIYVTEVSRLSRGSSREWGIIEESLRRAGIRIRTRSRTFDLTDPDDSNWLEVEALFGRIELRYMKLRAAAKRAEMLRCGQIRTGRVPWGYYWDKATKQPLPHPERFPVLQHLCRAALTESVHRLAERYGIPESTLLWTLTDPMICGWPAQRYACCVPEKGWSKPGHRLPRDQWRWPEQPGIYPTACTRAEWEALQAAIQRRALERSKTGYVDGWCRDVVRFSGEAGAVCLGSVKPQHGRQYLTYDLRRAGKPRLYVDREIVHATAAAALARVFTDSGLLAAALAAYHQATHSPAPAALGDPELLQRQLARLRARLAGLKEEEYDPEPGEEIRLANRTAQAKLARELARLKAELEAAHRAAAQVPTLEILWEELPSLGEQWPHAWEECSLPRRRLLVNACLETLLVSVRPGSRPMQRVVERVTYRSWLRPWLAE